MHKHRAFLTVFIYINFQFTVEEIKVKVAKSETWGQRIDSQKFFFYFIFWDIIYSDISKFPSISRVQI
jgi:hypothetical protein